MVNKKGKFRLLSYFIDTNLIYYKTINKEKKILAFAFFELSGYFPIEKILQNFLKRGLVLFYSVEININKPDAIIYILCIEHINKSEIFKNFNLISYKLNQVDQSIHFLKDEDLEKEFLKILSLDIKKKSLISNAIGSIRVKHDSTLKSLDFYLINYDRFPNGDDILYQLINYLGNLKRFGYLILNFQLINNVISAEIYYIDFIEDINPQISNLEIIVNEFFGNELIHKIKLELKKIYCPLWRYRLTNNQYSFEKISILHNFEHYYNHKNLLNFNHEFKELLEVNELEFHQLNQNLFFVEQSTLVIIIANMQFRLLLNLIKKFRSKYFLLIIVLNDKGYTDLMKIEKINSITNLKIINYEEFCRFDLKSIKKF